MVVSSDRACKNAPERAAALADAGAHLLVPVDDDLRSACRAVFGAGVTSLVLEGGPALYRAALKSDIVDAIEFYIAPRRIGPGGVPWLDAGQVAWETFTAPRGKWLGEDLLIQVHVHGHR
jgi:riboflavin biosynthesis pyrimidine reductase